MSEEVEFVGGNRIPEKFDGIKFSRPKGALRVADICSRQYLHSHHTQNTREASGVSFPWWSVSGMIRIYQRQLIKPEMASNLPVKTDYCLIILSYCKSSIKKLPDFYHSVSHHIRQRLLPSLLFVLHLDV